MRVCLVVKPFPLVFFLACTRKAGILPPRAQILNAWCDAVQYRRPAIFTNVDREFAMVSFQPFVLWLFRPKRRSLHGPRLPLTGSTLCYAPMTYCRVYTPVSHLERHGRLHQTILTDLCSIWKAT